MSAAWIAVACAEHVRRGRQGGFMQVCHGKAAPLRRIQPGDAVAYYSPTIALGDKAPCRSFTAAGIVTEREPYVVDMGAGFRPWRRDVRWFDLHETPIAPLLDRLAFTAGRRNWGYQLRFGLISVERADFEIILAAMTSRRIGASQAAYPSDFCATPSGHLALP
jgi:hypothetical protein